MMRRLHYTEAVAEAEARGEILVGRDEVLTVREGKTSAVAIHIVVDYGTDYSAEPKGYAVELCRPSFMYGAEGILTPLRFVGRVEELTSEELDAMSDDDPYWDLIPDYSELLFAMPKVPGFTEESWRRSEAPYWQAFRGEA